MSREVNQESWEKFIKAMRASQLIRKDLRIQRNLVARRDFYCPSLANNVHLSGHFWRYFQPDAVAGEVIQRMHRNCMKWFHESISIGARSTKIKKCLK